MKQKIIRLGLIAQRELFKSISYKKLRDETMRRGCSGGIERGRCLLYPEAGRSGGIERGKCLPYPEYGRSEGIERGKCLPYPEVERSEGIERGKCLPYPEAERSEGAGRKNSPLYPAGKRKFTTPGVYNKIKGGAPIRARRQLTSYLTCYLHGLRDQAALLQKNFKVGSLYLSENNAEHLLFLQ